MLCAIAGAMRKVLSTLTNTGRFAPFLLELLTSRTGAAPSSARQILPLNLGG